MSLVKPKVITLFIKRQRAFDVPIIFPYDISAMDYYMQMKHPDDDDPIDVSVTIETDNNTVTFSLTWIQTDALDKSYYDYDIIQIDGSGSPKTLCEGRVQVSNAITEMGT